MLKKWSSDKGILRYVVLYTHQLPKSGFRQHQMLVRIRKEKLQERPVHILKKTLEKPREKMSLYNPQSQPGQVQQSRTYRGPEGTH